MKNLTTLAHRHTELTRALILESAIGLLEHASISDLTIRAAAKQAQISERTVFRYFSSREEFLEGVADEIRIRLALPPAPTTIEEIRAAPRLLYAAFEAKPNLTKAALHPDILPRMRESQAKERWLAVRRVIDQAAPHCPESERKIAAANIRYFLSASTWHYYRFNFGFDLKDTIACAEKSIRQALGDVLVADKIR